MSDAPGGDLLTGDGAAGDVAEKGEERAADSLVLREAALPRRAQVYARLQSRVFRSAESWQAFLDQLPGEEGAPPLVEPLRALQPDFAQEQVVLLRHTEPSGSNRVGFQPPRISDGRVVFRVARQQAGIGTADMAYYAYVVVLPALALPVVKEVDGKEAEPLDGGK